MEYAFTNKKLSVPQSPFPMLIYIILGVVKEHKKRAPFWTPFSPFERETGLGPATPTLARSCSTN